MPCLGLGFLYRVIDAFVSRGVVCDSISLITGSNASIIHVNEKYQTIAK